MRKDSALGALVIEGPPEAAGDSLLTQLRVEFDAEVEPTEEGPHVHAG